MGPPGSSLNPTGRTLPGPSCVGCIRSSRRRVVGCQSHSCCRQSAPDDPAACVPTCSIPTSRYAEGAPSQSCRRRSQLRFRRGRVNGCTTPRRNPGRPRRTGTTAPATGPPRWRGAGRGHPATSWPLRPCLQEPRQSKRDGWPSVEGRRRRTQRRRLGTADWEAPGLKGSGLGSGGFEDGGFEDGGLGGAGFEDGGPAGGGFTGGATGRHGAAITGSEARSAVGSGADDDGPVVARATIIGRGDGEDGATAKCGRRRRRVLVSRGTVRSPVPQPSGPKRSLQVQSYPQGLSTGSPVSRETPCGTG